MKRYDTPSAELIKIHTSDVITLSAPDDLAGYDDKETAPEGWFN